MFLMMTSYMIEYLFIIYTVNETPHSDLVFCEAKIV